MLDRDVWTSCSIEETIQTIKLILAESDRETARERERLAAANYFRLCDRIIVVRLSLINQS